MSVEYWNHKLEKIQFAIEVLKDIKGGQDIDIKIRKLEELEKRTVSDLVEAEQAEELTK